MNQGIAPESLRDSYGTLPIVQPDSDEELGTNCEDFTLCEDDDIIGQIDPLIQVSSQHVDSITDPVRPHIKKDDSNSTVDGSQQVSPDQLVTLKSLKWVDGIVNLKLDNPANERTTVSILINLKITLSISFSASIFHLMVD